MYDIGAHEADGTEPLPTPVTYYVAKTGGGTSAADLATYEHFVKDVRI